MTITNKVSIYYFCVICVLFASCNRKTTKVLENPTNTTVVTTTPTVPTTPKSVEEDKTAYVVFSLERTACYGNCPVFEAKLMSNGKAYFSGRRGVEMIGNYEAKANPESLKEVWKNVAQVDFFKFADKYPIDDSNRIADLPITFTMVNDGKQQKRINDNYDSPANLQWFEHELETFFMQMEWKKVAN